MATPESRTPASLQQQGRIGDAALDPHYLAFFERFNQQLFFEAHDVLEELWLTQRGGPQDRFYKGLIQIAGAFVHLRKQRPQPAVALLKLAQTNLRLYPALNERLDVAALIRQVDRWILSAQRGSGEDLRLPGGAPRIELECA